MPNVIARSAISSGTALRMPSRTSIRASSRGGRLVCKASADSGLKWQGLHHTGFIVESLERSMEFYQGVLGLDVNEARPNDKLPYRGAWFWLGPDMIHLMELPNPDPTHLDFRPDHGGRDRHICVGIEDIAPLEASLDAANIPYTKSKSGRPAIFFRDPDCNTLEVGEALQWRSD